MLQYIIRRLLLAVPTMLVISFLAFALGKYAPGDPVVSVFGEELYQTLDPQVQAQTYRINAAKLGLDAPTFYFELTTQAYPDTLWRIFPLERRDRMAKLIGQTGNWAAVQQYDRAISKMVQTVEALPGNFPKNGQIRNELPLLIRADKLDLLDSAIHQLNRWMATDTLAEQHQAANTALGTAFSALQTSANALQTQHYPEKLRAPAFHWYGLNNQYHLWISGFLSGDLGLTRRKVAVWTELQSSLLATLVINGLAILLSYLLAIPLGVELARRKDQFFDRSAKRILVFLYSMPLFWLGGLLIMFVSNVAWVHALMPSVYFDIQDAWRPGTTSFGAWWSANAAKCVLPILILTLHALAVLALQMRSGMMGALGQDFIRTARAKGVSEEEVYWSHALRNALFPIITIFASLLPAVFTGSLVVEALFNFPGIGTKTFEAYMGKDLPLLSAIMMVAASLTILGSLLADILYAWADPRVKFAKENG